jgi:hypothetical protein
MTRTNVLRVLGRPAQTIVRRDLAKPFESWFYGPRDKFVIVFVDDKVFLRAENVH